MGARTGSKIKEGTRMPDNTGATNTDNTQKEPTQAAAQQQRHLRRLLPRGAARRTRTPRSIGRRRPVNGRNSPKPIMRKPSRPTISAEGKIADPNAGYLAISLDVGGHGVEVDLVKACVSVSCFRQVRTARISRT